MNIVLVSFAFPPGFGPGCARPLSWANHLAERGHRVRVICGQIDVQDNAGGGRDKSQEGKVHPRIERIALGGLGVDQMARACRGLRLTRIFRWFADPTTGWGVNVARWLHDNLQGDEVVLTTGWPWTAHLAALAIRKERSFPWIADYRDPWVQTDTLFPTRTHLRLARELDREIHQVADRVLYTSRLDARDAAAAYDVPMKKCRVVRNGVDDANFFVPGDNKPDPVILFAGNIYSGPEVIHPKNRVLEKLSVREIEYEYDGYSLVPLIKAIDRAREKNPAIQLRIAGGLDDDMVARAFSLAGVKDASFVEVLGNVEKDKLPELVQAASALYIPLVRRRDSNPLGWVPQKLFEVLAGDRPIIASMGPGETKDLLAARAGTKFMNYDVDVDAEVVLWAIHAAPARPAGRWRWTRESQARVVEYYLSEAAA